MTHNSLQLINSWLSNSRSNWNLEMLVFENGAKPENPEKSPRSKGENQQQTQPTYYAWSGNLTCTPNDLFPVLSLSSHVLSLFSHVFSLLRFSLKLSFAAMRSFRGGIPWQVKCDGKKGVRTSIKPMKKYFLVRAHTFS